MDFKENKPIYMQIVDKICSEIVTGKFPVNERIPSVREYGASLEVNANTGHHLQQARHRLFRVRRRTRQNPQNAP